MRYNVIKPFAILMIISMLAVKLSSIFLPYCPIISNWRGHNKNDKFDISYQDVDCDSYSKYVATGYVHQFVYNILADIYASFPDILSLRFVIQLQLYF